jgi:hypothetical protein
LKSAVKSIGKKESPMFHNDQNNQNDSGRRPSTLLREEVIDIGGQEIVNWTEAYVKKEDGSMVRQRKLNHQMAADGRWLMSDEFIAISWTGLAVPRDCIASCLNPFERHAYRLVYLYLDAKVTKFGNVLCTECWEHQKKRLFWKYLLFFGLIYNPEVY